MELNKENFDAIIIGSGIGGLVTASQLAAKGAQVLVLVKYIIPGGSGGSFKRKGYTFDVGASMIFGFGEKGYTNLLTRALKDVNEKCETIPDPVQLEYHLPNNFNISVDKNYQQFIGKLSASFPKEKKGIKKFYDTCARVFKCLDSMPLLSIEDPSYLLKVFFKIFFKLILLIFKFFMILRRIFFFVYVRPNFRVLCIHFKPFFTSRLCI